MAIKFITGNKNKFEEVKNILGLEIEQQDIDLPEIQDFGWGQIFQPESFDKTFGEMTREEKHKVSMRGMAARKLGEFLRKK